MNHWYPAKRHCIDQEVSEAFFENNKFHDLIGVFLVILGAKFIYDDFF